MLWLFLYVLGIVLGIFPTSHAYSATMRPGWNLAFIWDFILHWFMPFLTLFLVQLGGWAIGMRNMIIYETNTNYAKYMESLGASERLVRSYGFRNGILPQVTGLAISLGTIVSGAVLTQMVFSYPGLGYIMVQAIKQNDYFLIQGCFLFLISMVLLANFTIDIIYMFIDPRVRIPIQGRCSSGSQGFLEATREPLLRCYQQKGHFWRRDLPQHSSPVYRWAYGSPYDYEEFAGMGYQPRPNSTGLVPLSWGVMSLPR